MYSPACAQAMAKLEQLRRDKSPGNAQEAERQQASRACLGGPAPAQPVIGPALTPPIAVEPMPLPAQPAPPAPAAPPAPRPLSQPLHIERPSLVTNCDPSGCWNSEGQRLPRLGNELQGPRGPCTAFGTGYVCP